MNYCIVVPWHNREQLDKFLEAWNVHTDDCNYLILQEDKDKSGCAATKNLGIQEALRREAEIVIVLDDDCYPWEKPSLVTFAEAHLEAFEPQFVELYDAVTDPPSRGTPFHNREVTLPVAATMGFWVDNPDYDAPSQLVHLNKPMKFFRKIMFQKFFAFSGMNCAFQSEMWPYFRFDEEAPRYDDIFMGYALQAQAYKLGYCINLNGPLVRHVRQSNVWDNLKIEAENMERNENEWKKYL